jgi:negative regulator of flagellin synthesis FlgM
LAGLFKKAFPSLNHLQVATRARRHVDPRETPIMQVSGIHGPHGINAPHAPFKNQSTKEAAATPATGDRLEISPAAEAAVKATETGGIRQDVVNRIRSEIAAGTYETPDKLDGALNRLLDEIA